MTSPLLEFADVDFAYESGAPVIAGVSLAIARGERVALVGANGAGKTSLLLLATGILTPSRGLVRVHGTEVRRSNLREIRSNLGFVFADPDDQLFCPTVLDEVAFGPRQRGRARDASLADAQRALADVHLGDLAARAPDTLSLGEKKRLAIATVLACDVELVLLDEPTSSLDPRSRRRLIELLASLGRTLVFATHDLDAALDLGARVVLLDRGRVACEGSAAAVLGNAATMAEHGLELPLSVSRDAIRAEASDRKQRG